MVIIVLLVLIVNLKPIFCKISPYFQVTQKAFNVLHDSHYSNSIYVEDRSIDFRKEGSKIIFLTSNMANQGYTIDNSNYYLFLTVIDLNTIPLIKYRGKISLSNTYPTGIVCRNAKIISITPFIIFVNGCKLIRSQ